MIEQKKKFDKILVTCYLKRTVIYYPEQIRPLLIRLNFDPTIVQANIVSPTAACPLNLIVRQLNN